MKSVCFAAVTDGTATESIQIVLTPEQAKGLTIGSAIRVAGSWQGSPNKATQKGELVAVEVEILGPSDPSSFPLQKKSHSLEYMRTIPHLRSKSKTGVSLTLLRSATISLLQRFFESRGFLQVHPPIFTSSDCEGAGEVFEVGGHGLAPFYGKSVYLTVSAQLHLEALALSSSRVWTLGPVFRAEKSDTARHLNEFYMLEAELAFIDDIEQLMSLTESMIKELIGGIESDRALRTSLLEKRGDASPDGNMLEGRWAGLASKRWPRISYTDAIGILQKAVVDGTCNFKFPVEWGVNLQSEHEKFIAEYVGEGSPVFVTHFPMELKPFYMLPTQLGQSTEPRPTVACFDLLVPQVGEIIGGSLREHRYDVLENTMRKHFNDDARRDLSWYLDLRKWGSVPHGGFGLGFDRLLAYIAGLENIREMVTFPRWYDRCLC
ncbi:hypothetical protein ABW19_dt0204815 [Dactylella cylindrospora]|nr:hypothetical protein ABW19_dt0204815 [Dactylella cylindrospora]